MIFENKKGFMLVIVILAIVIGSVFVIIDKHSGKTVNQFKGYTPKHTNVVKLEKISDEVERGLYKVNINDTINIILYKGTQSVTMIQVK
jgi:uncharacterized protein YxeA